MAKRIKYTVHGEVQGQLEDDNFAEAKVEGEAQGDDEAIQKLLKVLESGPPAASVTKVEKSEVDTKEGESSYATA
ncbi:MAG: hypothetical protein Q9205_002433 [Flavoplaca limonia]